MSDDSGSSLSRMLAILDRFNIERFEWTVEDLSQAMGYTPSSAYRYVRALSRAGLLTRLPAGTYVVGAKIIELEALTRRVDPIVLAAQPVLAELSRQTGCTCMLSSVYGDRLINVAQHVGLEPVEIAYTRGEPLPWFRGAPGPAVLAFMSTQRARKLYEKFGEARAEKLPSEDADDRGWREMRGRLKTIRQAGYCVSFGELQSQLVGFGVPVIPQTEPIGSISLVCTRQRADLLDSQGIGKLIVEQVRGLNKKIAP
ncbi:MAG: helix-turn-helix domain-containing protein [Ottowia sp.]|uniref:IclR family transcriptional regulator n=1 Tax=Ottowia sp. TaxID=1898956 RepID=UPI003C763116